MTTVAYKAGVMAADTQMTFSDESKGRVSKILRLDDGSLFACAGHIKPVNKLRAWAKTGFDPTKKPGVSSKSSIEALLIKPDGSIWYYDWTLEADKLENEFFAIGSGRPYALGALASGKTAVQAVKIAAQFDTNTSEPIDKMELKID